MKYSGEVLKTIIKPYYSYKRVAYKELADFSLPDYGKGIPSI